MGNFKRNSRRATVTYHDVQTAHLFDSRRTPRKDVMDEEIYYVVHRVKVGNAMWYHHGIMLADGLEMACSGLLQLQEHILSDVGSAVVMRPIFLRNLMAADPQVLDETASNDIAEQIESACATGLEDKFVVFGLVGTDKLTLMNVRADDAFAAAALVADTIFKQTNKTFLPIDISIGHPVVEELDRHFVKAASDIQIMLGVSPISMH